MVANTLTKTIDILDQLTDNIVTIKQKTDTLLTEEMYNLLNDKINELSGLFNNTEQNPGQNPGQIPGPGGNTPPEVETTGLGQSHLHTIMISGLEPYQADYGMLELNGTYTLYDKTVQFSLTNPTKCIYYNVNGACLIYQENKWCIYADAWAENRIGTTTCPDNLTTDTYVAIYDQSQQNYNFSLTTVANNIPPFPILQKIIITDNTTQLDDLNGEYIVTESTKNNWAYNQREYSNGIYTIKCTEEQNDDGYYILALYKNDEYIGYIAPYNYVEAGDNPLCLFEFEEDEFTITLDLNYKNYN